MKNTIHTDENIDKLLREYSKTKTDEPSKYAIEKTVYAVEKIIEITEKRLSFMEFILFQFQIMQKRWWVLQAALLFCAGEWLAASGDANYTHRGLSIIASLFVIFIIPELWKNRENRSIEIEESSLFDLRRIYAAKLIIFGFVDTLFLTLFCFLTVQIRIMLFADILKQFVFPIMIAAIICLMSFSKARKFSDITTIFICMGANVAWMMLVINETVYFKITPMLWSVLFCAGVFLIAYFAYKSLNKNNKYWEGQIDGLDLG